MDRRAFLNTMLQGCLATALVPDSITSLFTSRFSHATTSHQLPYPSDGLSPTYSAVSDPVTARNIAKMIADITNSDSFVGIDHGDVKTILQSGWNRHFASYQAAGPEQGSTAGRGVLAKLQQQIPEDQAYSGALACIYCNAKTYQHDFDQAIAELFCFFLPSSTSKFNMVYNCVIDEKLVDEVRVTVLAIT